MDGYHLTPGVAEQSRRGHRVAGAEERPVYSYRARGCNRCGRATREGKPWCADHILDSAYARRLSDAWDRRMASKALTGIKLRLALAREPTLLADARGYLLHVGPSTVPGLARILSTRAEVADRVVDLLVRRGEARAWRNTRQVRVVELLL